MSEPRLPDFARPPAVETLLGLHFAPIRWTIPHFGLFWAEIRTDYPQFEVHPPIGEFRVELDSKQAAPHFDLPIRCWFINETQNRLLQVQRNGFFHNWRKIRGSEEYLHYRDIRPLFANEWSRFVAFAEKADLGKPEVTQCEVTYINHLEKGAGWKNFSELPKIFPCWRGSYSMPFLPEPRFASIAASYQMPERNGTLDITAQPALRQADAIEIIQLTITAKLRPASSAAAELVSCLDLGRRWVDLGFYDFTSAEMHKLWGERPREGE